MILFISRGRVGEKAKTKEEEEQDEGLAQLIPDIQYTCDVVKVTSFCIAC